jgi:thiol-disulfide isomerase/thioredoxin
MRLRYTLMALICSCSLYAQQPLSIGDPVPDVQLDKWVNHSPSMATLSGFKGKIVIIDFWATWCTACLHAFDKLDSLQTLFLTN